MKQLLRIYLLVHDSILKTEIIKAWAQHLLLYFYNSVQLKLYYTDTQTFFSTNMKHENLPLGYFLDSN